MSDKRTLTVAAWRVTEGDSTAGGARVISVVRNAATGHVHIALSTGETLDLAGARSLTIAARVPQLAWWSRALAVLIAASRGASRP